MGKRRGVCRLGACCEYYDELAAFSRHKGQNRNRGQISQRACPNEQSEDVGHMKCELSALRLKFGGTSRNLRAIYWYVLCCIPRGLASLWDVVPTSSFGIPTCTRGYKVSLGLRGSVGSNFAILVQKYARCRTYGILTQASDDLGRSLAFSPARLSTPACSNCSVRTNFLCASGQHSFLVQ